MVARRKLRFLAAAISSIYEWYDDVDKGKDDAGMYSIELK